VNATHHEVPVTEEVEKTAIIKDDKTGKETEIKVKVPETKMRIIPKTPPVAQNSTHEIVPVTDIEEKEIPVADTKSGKIKKVIEKVPVTKNKVIPKVPGETPLATTPTVEAPLEGTAAVTPVTPPTPASSPVPLASPAVATPVAAPVAQNSTHEVVPVVEEE
jgi:hypothetical protein